MKLQGAALLGLEEKAFHTSASWGHLHTRSSGDFCWSMSVYAASEKRQTKNVEVQPLSKTFLFLCKSRRTYTLYDKQVMLHKQKGILQTSHLNIYHPQILSAIAVLSTSDEEQNLSSNFTSWDKSSDFPLTSLISEQKPLVSSEELKTYTEQITEVTDALELEMKQPAPTVPGPVLWLLDSTAKTPVALSMLPLLPQVTKVARGKSALPSLTSWWLEDMDRVLQEDWQFLSAHPIPYSVVGQTIMSINKHWSKAVIKSCSRIDPTSETFTDLYSNYFAIPKRDGNIKPLLYLRGINAFTMTNSE